MKNILIILGLTLMLLLSGCQNGTNNETVDSFLQDFDEIFSFNRTNVTEEETDQKIDESDIEVEEKDSKIPTKIVSEGDLIEIRKDIAYDPDGGDLVYEFSAPFDSDGIWQTKIGDAGEYYITITASDGRMSSSMKAKVIVEAVNLPPVVTNFEDITIKEGDLIELNPVITDPDGDEVTFYFTGFMNSSTYQTTFDDAGEYQVTLVASDGFSEVRETITITIEDVNRPPVITGLENIEVTEGETAILDFHVSDPDGDAVSVSIAKPFNQDGIWQTEIGDAGEYQIQVKATDGIDEVTETVRVIVNRFNRPPVLTVPERIEVDEGDLIEINPEVYDPDGDALKITYSGFMTSSTYQTDFGDAGTYVTRVHVTDGIDTVYADIEIEINKVNRPPVFVTDNIFK